MKRIYAKSKRRNFKSTTFAIFSPELAAGLSPSISPDGREREVWTGSCPCQPFSQAGKRKGNADERHLWPDFLKLIAERSPATIFGEQVASKDGRKWLAGVRSDLEALGYAVGAADLCAAGEGAPHIRQRLYWVAHSNRAGAYERASGREQPFRDGVHEAVERVDNILCNGWLPRRDDYWQDDRNLSVAAIEDGTKRLADSLSDKKFQKQQRPSENEREWRTIVASGRSSHAEGLGDSAAEGLQGQRSEYRPCGERCGGLVGFAMQAGVPEWNGPTVAVECSDGYRRVSSQPNAFPLAHGVLKRMGKLRGSGNAIVPQTAAKFIRAFLEAEKDWA